MNLLIKYLKALKWVCENDNIDIVILPNGDRINESLRNKDIREKWIKLNAEISKEATESPVFDSYLNVMLAKYDKERKDIIEKARETQ